MLKRKNFLNSLCRTYQVTKKAIVDYIYIYIHILKLYSQIIILLSHLVFAFEAIIVTVYLVCARSRLSYDSERRSETSTSDFNNLDNIRRSNGNT